jgi:hypothetical protein
MDFYKLMKEGKTNECVNNLINKEYSETEEFSLLIHILDTLYESNKNEEAFLKCLKNTSIKLNKMGNCFIKGSAECGLLSCVTFLMTQKDVDPSANESQALISACKNGSLNIVKELLKDNRVKPDAYSHHTLIIAVENNHIDLSIYLYQREDIIKSLEIIPKEERNKILAFVEKHNIKPKLKNF